MVSWPSIFRLHRARHSPSGNDRTEKIQCVQNLRARRRDRPVRGCRECLVSARNDRVSSRPKAGIQSILRCCDGEVESGHPTDMQRSCQSPRIGLISHLIAQAFCRYGFSTVYDRGLTGIPNPLPGAAFWPSRSSPGFMERLSATASAWGLQRKVYTAREAGQMRGKNDGHAK